MLEYLIAVALLSGQIYSGQGDIWYARACMARELLRRWFQISDPTEWIHADYVKQGCQRRAAAIYWRMCRKYLMRVHHPDGIEHHVYLDMRREHCEERQSPSSLI